MPINWTLPIIGPQTVYLSWNQLKDFLEIWLTSKISNAQNFLDQTISKRGCCQKITLLSKFSHLLQDLERALKFQICDKKANLSD